MAKHSKNYANGIENQRSSEMMPENFSTYAINQNTSSKVFQGGRQEIHIGVACTSNTVPI